MLAQLLLRGSAVFVLAALAAPAIAADISADMAALVSDVLKPYGAASGTPPAGADSPAVKAALEVLRKEQLLDVARPATGTTDLAEPYGKALALGTRTSQFLPEIGGLHDALTRMDESGAKDAIRDLYRKAGRTPPDGDSLRNLYRATRALHGAEPKETQRVEIKKPDHSVALTWARAAGKVKVEVEGRQDQDGKPFRTTFEGDVVTRPDGVGSGLELGAKPARAPRTMTADEATALREELNGTWFDHKGHKWEVSGEGTSITLTEIYKNGHRVAYRGRYHLGKVSGEHVVTTPQDVVAEVPLKVRQQLAARYKPSFRVSLEVGTEADQMAGTWSSHHVTYSARDQTVERLHDPYDQSLVLMRKCEVEDKRKPTPDVASKPALVVLPTDSMEARVSLESVTKGQAFYVFVRMGRDQADKAGAAIDVTLRAKKAGSSARVRLGRRGSPDGKSVVYGPEAPMVIAEVGMRLAHVGLSVRNGDTIVASYGEASEEFDIYDSWVQQGIARHEWGFTVLQELYNGLLLDAKSPVRRDELHQKIIAIRNARRIIQDYKPGAQENFTDYTRYYIGEAYHWLLGAWGQGEPATYYYPGPLREMGWRTGRGVHDKQFDIVLTSGMESQLIRQAIWLGEKKYGEMFWDKIVPATAMGMYTTIVALTGVEDFHVLLFGTDALGNQVNNTDRALAGVSAIGRVLVVGGTLAQRLQQLRKGRGPIALGNRPPAASGRVTGGAGPRPTPVDSHVGVSVKPPTDAPTLPGARPLQAQQAGKGTPVQFYGDTCGINVAEGMRRDAGFAYRKELDSMALAYQRGHYQPGRMVGGAFNPAGMTAHGLAAYLAEEGAMVATKKSMKLVQMLADVEAGRQIAVMVKTPGGGHHWVRVEGTRGCGANLKVVYGDPWHGRSFEVSAKTFAKHNSGFAVVAEWVKR